jgi:hypothetical protein
MPRSGTTWLARLLASAPGTALTGREPMNPRGRQYALGGTLSGWAELCTLSPRQERALRRAYRGHTPRVFSRYGRRQWAAPAPWTRLVVKDPYAMLSLPVVVRTTAATPVLLYRHPAAALVSYRRMGWQPSAAELRPVLEEHQRTHSGARVGAPVLLPGDAAEAEIVARFWSALYEIALDHAAETDQLLVVSHEELSAGGTAAARQLFERLGLRWNDDAETEVLREGGRASAAPHDTQHALHDLNRAPREVAAAWRAQLEPDELIAIEDIGGDVLDRLQAARLKFD